MQEWNLNESRMSIAMLGLNYSNKHIVSQEFPNSSEPGIYISWVTDIWCLCDFLMTFTMGCDFCNDEWHLQWRVIILDPLEIGQF